MSAPPSSPKKLTRLQDRYELLDELPNVTGGRLFRARDLAFAEMVGVKQFGEGCGLPPEGGRQLEATVRHLQCLAHPNLIRLYSFDAAAGILVQEWVQGISLLDLLRRRRELPVGEALRLLAALPATLDFLAREAVATPHPLLGKLLIQFENQAAAEGSPATSVDKWPSFVLKLNALSIRELVAAPTEDDTTNTVIADPRQPTDISDSYGPREFARLLYELLGGRIRELDSRRYIPIGALREAGNAVLRRTLLAMPHPTCEALWRDLLEAQPEFQRIAAPAAAHSLPSRRALTIPEPLLGGAHPGEVLNLDPVESGATSIRLVARARFNIGRSPQQADFIARVMPENETNNALTNRLSRIHTFLERSGQGLQARDGNGKGPSLNGSFLDGEPLAPDPAMPVTNRSVLWLGEEYGVELIPVYETAPRNPPISNLEAWSGAQRNAAEDGPGGALVCQPARSQPAVRHAAWLFTEAGFGLDAAGNLVWDTRGRSSSPAAFHYHRGCFWVSNRTLPETALACGDTPLARDTIAPLTPGQTVRMGSHIFLVRLE
jgi:hypothetical protein